MCVYPHARLVLWLPGGNRTDSVVLRPSSCIALLGMRISHVDQINAANPNATTASQKQCDAQAGVKSDEAPCVQEIGGGGLALLRQVRLTRRAGCSRKARSQSRARWLRKRSRPKGRPRDCACLHTSSTEPDAV